MIELHQPSKQQIATWDDDQLINFIANLRPDWQYDAACKGQDNSEVFYPGRGAPPTDGIIQQYCNAGCPVKSECLEYGLENHTNSFDYGVWGGTTPNMRRQIRRARALGLPDPDFTIAPTISNAKVDAKRARIAARRDQGYCSNCAYSRHSRCGITLGTCQCNICSPADRKELVSA